MAASHQCLSFSQSKESRPLSLPCSSRLCSGLLPGIPPNCQSFFLYTTIPRWHVQGTCLGPCPVHTPRACPIQLPLQGVSKRHVQDQLPSYRSFLNMFRRTYVNLRLNLGELHGIPTTYSLYYCSGPSVVHYTFSLFSCVFI